MSFQGITEGPRSTANPPRTTLNLPSGREATVRKDVFHGGHVPGRYDPHTLRGRAPRRLTQPHRQTPSPSPEAPKTHGWADAMRHAWPHNKLTALQTAMADNDVRQVRSLLQNGANVEERDTMGHSALHIAAALNSEKFVELLLEHGATLEANDNMGMTPVYCAAQFKALGALELLLDEAKATTPQSTPWYSLEMLGAMCAALRQHHQHAPEIDTEAVDSVVQRLVGIQTKKLDQLTKLEPMLVYRAHLLSLTGDQFDLELEGWNEIDMLLQRVRSLLRMAALPAPLPPGVVPAILGSALVHELRCDLEQIRLVHRFLVLEHLPEGPRRMELLRQEARRLSWMVRKWPLNEEFSIPTGFPEHSCYVCFSRRVIDGETVITVRLDNLGSTQRAAQFTDDDGRVTPFSFNIPESFLGDATGADALTQAIERLLTSRVDGGTDDHALNAGLYTLLRHVKRGGAALVIEQTPFAHADFHHKAQSVGNCVLKNHSAGMCARMGRTLFKWFKRREIADVETRLSGVMAPGVLRACEAEKWQTQWLKLLEKDNLNVGDVQTFFSKPGRDSVLWGLDDNLWRKIFRRDDVALFELVRERGASLPDITPRVSTPLHWAIDAKAPEIAMALLRCDIPVDAVDGHGRTALHLAVKAHDTRLVNMLLAWGADASIADDDRETAEALVRTRAHRASQMHRNFTRATARRRANSSGDEMTQARRLRDHSQPSAATGTAPIGPSVPLRRRTSVQAASERRL